MKTVSTSYLFGFIALFATASCGGGGFRGGNDWDASEDKLFDDGIDLVRDLSKLSGGYAYNAEQELNARVNLADTVALIVIESVQTTNDLDGVEAKRITVIINRLLYGKTPSNTLVLESSGASRGYTLILRHETHLAGKHIVFVRWFENEDGTISNHFHISPASADIRDRLHTTIEARKEAEKRCPMGK